MSRSFKIWDPRGPSVPRKRLLFTKGTGNCSFAGTGCMAILMWKIWSFRMVKLCVKHQGICWFLMFGTWKSMFAERFGKSISIASCKHWHFEYTAPDKWLNDVQLRCWRSYYYGQDFTDGTNIAGLAEDQIPARIRESNCILQAVLCGEGKGYVTHILLKCMLTLPRKKDSKWNIELVKVCVRLWNFWGWLMSPSSKNFLHPGRLTWNITMEVWKIIFLSKWLISMFHVNLPGCKQQHQSVN